jgi:hypothetical protein
MNKAVVTFSLVLLGLLVVSLTPAFMRAEQSADLLFHDAPKVNNEARLRI